jgi:hypothetical protein
MQSLFGFGLVVIFAAGASAQFRSPGRVIVSPSPPALGGNFATHGLSHPLGGISSPANAFPGKSGSRLPGNRLRAPYFGPIFYVPNAFDSTYPYYNDSLYYSEPAVPPLPSYAPQPSPPVIINQYFSSFRPGEETTSQSDENGSTSAFQPAEQPARPGDPIGTPENYYLIAYKNHAIYTALAYWVEDKTLHYVTTQNTHNQASLDLIDIERTTKLNADRSVPFSISAQ